MSRTELFDYEKMAREAARERDAIKTRLDIRRRNRPGSHEAELIWKRENSILYTMYLEQRSNERKFSQRAKERAQRAKKLKWAKELMKEPSRLCAPTDTERVSALPSTAA